MAAAEASAPDAQAATRLRGEAERAAGALPPLLVAAERLASTVILGAHGRRRSGPGETFWQYRRAMPGDSAGAIDWRRSGRGDVLYVRETEWELSQTVWIWCDKSRAMSYRSDRALPSKGERAALLSAAIAVLLTRGGERIATPGHGRTTGADRPRAGETHLRRVAMALSEEDEADFGAAPPLFGARGGRALFISDFFGDEAEVVGMMNRAVAAGVSGVLYQVVDPSEESFPFEGRVIFESMTGALSYDAEKAQSLRASYLDALRARRDRLSEAARRAGWRFETHRTNEPAAPALLWIARAIGAGLGGATGGGSAGAGRGWG